MEGHTRKSRGSNGSETIDDANNELRRKNKAILGLRVILVIMLVGATTTVASLTAVYMSREERMDFNSKYEDSVVKVAEGFQNGVDAKTWSATTFSAIYTSRYGTDNTKEEPVWPNATMPDFQEQADKQLKLANGRALSFNPIIKGTKRVTWERYAAKSAWILGAPSLVERQHPEDRIVSDGIFTVKNGKRIDDPGHAEGSLYPDILVPVWQIAPIVKNEKAVMFNLHGETNRQRALDDMLAYKVPTLTAILQLVQDSELRPSSILFYPVMDRFRCPYNVTDTCQTVVGSISIVFSWDDVLRQILPNYIKGLVCVLESSIGQMFTYSITGDTVTLLGEGDLHDSAHNNMVHTVHANLEGTSEVLGKVDFLITYKLRIYPSEEFESQYVTSRPGLYTLGVVLIFSCTSILFLVYDFLVEHRQNSVVRAANRTGNIVDAMFPPSVRERMFQSISLREQRNVPLATFTEDSSNTTSASRSKNRPCVKIKPIAKIHQYLRRSASWKADSENPIDPDESIADHFKDTSIMFSDLVGFTEWSSEREPNEVFQLLEHLFCEFDELATLYGVFKLGTIGDCYIAVTGLPEPVDKHALILAEYTIECQKRVVKVMEKLSSTIRGTERLGMRFGIHSGAVTAGVLRGHKSRFELFGDTINTASRMESTGMMGKIHVSEKTAALLREGGKDDWLTPRESLVYVKGKGELQTYWLEPKDPTEKKCIPINPAA